MTRAALLRTPPLPALGLFLGCYLALDWATFSPGFSPLGITPWNPPMGLAVGFVLLKGMRYAPVLGIAPLLGDLLVRQVQLPLWLAVAEAALIGMVYALALWLLLRPERRFTATLQSLSDLLQLFAVVVVAAAAVAVAYVAVLVAAGLLAPGEMVASVLRYWVGDVIGIAVLTPFLLVALTHERLPRHGVEALLQIAAILLAIAIVLGPGVRYQSQLSYVLFLPIVWVAVRKGLEVVSAALVLMQVGIMAALHLGPGKTVDVTELQAMLLVLVLAGLAIGMLTSERERAERKLRRQQDAIARAARIGSAESLSATIAHEVNQPLTAISNYARVAARALAAEPPGLAEAHHAVGQVITQVDRAGGVIRRVRDFITGARIELGTHRVERLIGDTLDVMAPEIESSGATVGVEVPRTLPPVSADLVQIQQVLANIVKNALEAMDALPTASRRLAIRACLASPGAVEIEIRDWGPGFPPDFRLEPLTPAATDKPEGLGMGLAISQSIVEAHGGRLVVGNAVPGAVVRFTLKVSHGDLP